MKKFAFLYLFVVCITPLCQSQISYGGRPLPFVQTKRQAGFVFEEMHSFDVEEELALDSLNESDLRSGRRFAYKFITDFKPNNSGTVFYQPDGTKVWRLGIRSKGAYNINILFTEYELPEGACVFVYNSGQTHILGAFNYLNNSEFDLLPVAPVRGDEIIIEYQEPRNAAFSGRLTVGEVNHAYRDLRGYEPDNINSAQYCMPPLACYDDGREITADQGRSVILLIVDGTVGCTGTLMNNTANDGTPYLLTASHCLNKSFSVDNPDYVKAASTIISFFNYESPLCDTRIRGTEEMSMASAHLRAVNEEYDMLLLELLQVPPVYYRPYYSGWKATDTGTMPYYNIHHPSTSIKRINTAEITLRLRTFDSGAKKFAENGHWFVSTWVEGSTAGGSSGSPLFDRDGYVMGALSGGSSFCAQPKDDYFYALSQAWSADSLPEKQLDHWLNPAHKVELVCKGFDPYAEETVQRLSNVKASTFAESIEISGVNEVENRIEPVFGQLYSDDNGTEYAEEYNCIGTAQVYGSFFVTSGKGAAGDMDIEVTVYEGKTKPERILHTEVFRPYFIHYDHLHSGEAVDSIKPLDRLQETYIHFENPVEVKDKFFVGYRVLNVAENGYFAAANIPGEAINTSTAWVKNQGEWSRPEDYSPAGFHTGLFIDPLINGFGFTGNETQEQLPIHIIVGSGRQFLSVQLPEGIEEGTLSLYSANGANINNVSLKQNLSIVYTHQLHPGIYIVKVMCGSRVYSQKVLL